MTSGAAIDPVNVQLTHRMGPGTSRSRVRSRSPTIVMSRLLSRPSEAIIRTISSAGISFGPGAATARTGDPSTTSATSADAADRQASRTADHPLCGMVSGRSTLPAGFGS